MIIYSGFKDIYRVREIKNHKNHTVKIVPTGGEIDRIIRYRVRNSWKLMGKRDKDA